MTTKEKIAVMQAFLDGKTIQKLYDDCWEDYPPYKEPDWDWSCDYRVKPKQKVRPYRHAEEFLEAQKEHGMYILRPGENDENHYDLPISVCDKCVTLDEETGVFLTFSYREISQMIWQDGTPCGIAVED